MWYRLVSIVLKFVKLLIYLLMLIFSFLVIPGIVVTILAIYELIVAMMVNDNGDGKITLKKGFVLTKPD